MTEKPSRSEQRLALFPTLLAYGAPALPLYALLLVIGFLPYYYRLHLGFDYAAAGLLVLLTRLWDVVTDPAIGILSDRTRTRLGRRRPWLLAALPVLFLGLWQVFYAAPGIGAVTVGLWTMLLFLGWTMVALPLNAWGAEISTDYHMRARVSAVREALALAGTLTALVVLAPAVEAGGTALGRAFEGLGLGLAVAFAVSILLAAVLVPESAATRQGGTAAKWWDLRTLVANRPLRQLSVSFLLNGIANGLPPILFLYYMQSVLGAGEDAAKFILLYFLCGILGVPLWTWLGRRLGKHGAWRLAMTVAAVCFLPAGFLGPGDLGIYLAVVIATGLCLGADFFLPPAIAADVADQDEMYSGRARAGLFYALLGMLYKASWALAGAAGLFALALTGFDESLGRENPPLALAGVSTMYALVPAGFKLLAVFVLRGFALDEAAHYRLRAQLAAGEGPDGAKTAPENR